MARIAILNSESRKALAIVRNLGKDDNTIFCISDKVINISAYSKYSVKGIRIDDYNEKKLNKVLSENEVEFVIPCEEDTVELLSKSIVLKKKFTCIVPEYDSFSFCVDKSKTIELARKLKIRIPESYYPDNEENMDMFVKKLSDSEFPILLKPIRSSGSRGIKICNNYSDYNNVKLEFLSKYGLPLIQEYIPHGGDAIGVSFGYYHGKAQFRVAHKRIREFPVSGGPSSLCESINNKKAEKLAQSLLDELEWNGLAMVEFMTDPRNDELVLMEINPRAWGSIRLLEISGISLTDCLINPYINNKATSEIKIARGNVKLRWYLPADVLSIMFGNGTFMDKTKRIIMPIRGEIGYMIYEKGDYLPLLFYLFDIVVKLFNFKKVRQLIWR
ncbi:ATP-grasp domain-containing protein [Acidaminobacter sp. JC074]|uniref:carboxylate--amine ligase n=1 Tax=Acidaminobacter sp. JC074 TaxID=2530199 RepID=UPI001F0CF8F3|nr:ATP-grasp domain-containing protein [Acidaminobacter sp. JC074]MCH4890649.1 ATP-grasp domain-containing protein [Acidaminobacter sp. JC074]